MHNFSCTNFRESLNSKNVKSSRRTLEIITQLCSKRDIFIVEERFMFKGNAYLFFVWNFHVTEPCLTSTLISKIEERFKCAMSNPNFIPINNYTYRSEDHSDENCKRIHITKPRRDFR